MQHRHVTLYAIILPGVHPALSRPIFAQVCPQGTDCSAGGVLAGTGGHLRASLPRQFPVWPARLNTAWRDEGLKKVHYSVDTSMFLGKQPPYVHCVHALSASSYWSTSIAVPADAPPTPAAPVLPLPDNPGETTVLQCSGGGRCTPGRMRGRGTAFLARAISIMNSRGAGCDRAPLTLAW